MNRFPSFSPFLAQTEMKRRENFRSSSTSSHRETTPENHLTRNIGCISGIFQLISKYQHRRKFLTSSSSAANSEKEKISVNTLSSSPSRKPKSEPAAVVLKNSSSPSPSPSPSPSLEKTTPPLDSDFKRFSLDELRSPTIPSKIRLSNSDDSSSPKKLPRSPALVARLMGLDEIPPASDPILSPPPVSSVEKRRKLMEALEKCDEDLKVLKNIIEALRSTDSSRSEVIQTREESDHPASSLMIIRERNNNRWLFDDECLDGRDSSMKNKDKKCWDIVNTSTTSDDQPSPVSVLDHHQISPDSPSNCRLRQSTTTTTTTTAHHQIGEKYKKLKEESANSLTNFHKITFEALPISINSGRKGSSDINYQCEYFSSTGVNNNRSSSSSATSFEFQSNKSKVESVNEVCMDAVWAERWELGRIGVVLEDHIFQMLIQEIVRELGFNSYISSSSLPFEKCRKRLSF